MGRHLPALLVLLVSACVPEFPTGTFEQDPSHDFDGDGFSEAEGDCDDGSASSGVDAAELSGWSEPTGITATDDIDALISLRPDACCYNPLWPSVDELVALLESGVNVCSSAAWMFSIIVSRSTCMSFSNATPSMKAGTLCRIFFASAASLP